MKKVVVILLVAVVVVIILSGCEGDVCLPAVSYDGGWTVSEFCYHYDFDVPLMRKMEPLPTRETEGVRPGPEPPAEVPGHPEPPVFDSPVGL